MRKLDPQLEYLVEGGASDAAAADQEIGAMEAFGLESAPPVGKKRPVISANVLVQYAGDPDDLAKAGMVIHGVAGDVVTGMIPVDAVDKVAKLDSVERIEAARPLETELNTSLPEARVDLVHAGPPGRRGAGVIVGIVDTGCDYTHPSFRKSDGTSRILAIWDQALTPAGGEANPSGFGYGVEYTQTQINAALASANPTNLVRHTDPFRHGTHVTGIAAGDGSIAGQGQPAGTFLGVAPEADIIIVANRSNGPEGLGTSANTLDAVNYIYQKGAAFDKAAVVNMSLGDNLGPHDGTSLLERGLDNLLGAKGRAFVKSAGNAGTSNCHAGGTLTTGETEDVRFNQPGGDQFANQIDLWYDGGDVFRVSLIDPSNNIRGPVSVGTVSTVSFPGGNSARIDHRGNDPFNGDKRVFITISRGTASTIASGTWRLRVQAISAGSGGRFDAWIQRGSTVPTFLTPHVSSAMTISTPGTAREVITAANYSSKGFSSGSLVSSSSRGPTRDGRAAPTIAAPGASILSARSSFGSGDPYTQMTGTSMAAPHVTGTIALMFQKNRDRTQAQIKACLESSARTDGNTGPTPNTAWGSGKLDANAAVNCVPNRFVRVTVVPVLCRPSVAIICRTTPITCRPSVATICPTRTITCRPSVATICPTRTIITCRPSVVTICRTSPILCRPTAVVQFCPTVAQPQCRQPSVVAPCQSVPALTCGGPSVVDGCPSTPGGCFDPGRFTRTPVDPRVVNDPAVVTPNLRGFAGRFGQSEADDDAGFVPFEEDLYQTAEEIEAAVAEAYSEVEVPEQGYFDYDDSWFDPED